MPAKDRETLKSYFNTGDVPTEQEYGDLIDTIVDGAPGGGGGGHEIEDEGIPLPKQPKLNFIGNEITVTNNPETQSTDVTIVTPPGITISKGPGINVVVVGMDRQIGLSGNTMLLKHSSGLPIAEVEPTDLGFDAINSLIVPGDELTIPQCSVLSLPHTLMPGCTYRFPPNLIVNGVITLAPECWVFDLHVEVTGNSEGVITGIVGSNGIGKSHLIRCHSIPLNLGSGIVHALSHPGTTDIYGENCYFDGRNQGGAVGYAGYLYPNGGNIFLDGGTCLPTIDPFNV